MGARAITEWYETDSGSPALFQRNPWLSPSTFLPALADFVHAARETGQAPRTALFREWAAEHMPCVLGDDETSDRMTFLRPGSDVQFHYLIQRGDKLSPTEHAVRVTAREKIHRRGTAGRWEVTHQAGTDDELYELAADILSRQAARIRQLAAEGRGGPMPPAHEVEARAERIRARRQPDAAGSRVRRDDTGSTA